MSDLSWTVIVIASFIVGGLLATLFWWIQDGDWHDDED